MGVDTTQGGAYGRAGPSKKNSKPPQRVERGTRCHAPIDLTDVAPPKKSSRKRKGVELEAEDVDPDAKSAKKKAKPRKNEEKRLKRFREKPPLSYGEVRDRALTQRMFVIERQRTPPSDDEDVPEDRRHPTETIQLAGTTGNIYTITIDKVPTCDCPHAQKGNQCKHVIYVLSRVLRAPYELEYQLAFVSSELREIFEKAPPLPSETADDSKKDGNRKPLEGECPICCVDFEPDNKKEEVVYCKAACGNNVHKACFQQWAATKRGGAVTCPFCRTPWEGDDNLVKNVAKTGHKNEEGYVNVASQLGLSGERDYSTYNEFWMRRRFGWDY